MQDGQTLLVACHIPQILVLKNGVEHVKLPIKTEGNHENCFLDKERTEYSIYPMSSLPADLCDAWRITVGRLHTAFHLAHNDTDNLQVANYYTSLNHLIELCSLEQEEQHLNGMKSSGSDESFNSDEEEYFKLSIDTVEYFPQPPIARADPSPRIVKSPSGQYTVDKTISRPGRTYV